MQLNNKDKKLIIDRSIEYAKEKMSLLHSSHGWDHILRVINISEKICTGEPEADQFIVKISAILHDIARAEEDQSKGGICHAKNGSELALSFLSKLKMEKIVCQKISDAILTHRYRDDNHPESIEAKILFDADKLDSIGAVGIGRAFLFAGEIGARLHNSEIDILKTEAYGKEDSAYREYIVKLQHVKNRMLTKTGRAIAENRDNFMKQFFNRLDNEIFGDL